MIFVVCSNYSNYSSMSPFVNLNKKSMDDIAFWHLTEDGWSCSEVTVTVTVTIEIFLYQEAVINRTSHGPHDYKPLFFERLLCTGYFADE